MSDLSTASTLIVPVQVDALVVDSSVRAQGFRRWEANFNLLRYNHSPEPGPFESEQTWNEPGDDKHDGVYVRWMLPDALRHGQARTPDGPPQFPLVPNRWLVIRRVKDNKDHTTGWMVESDFLHPDNGTSPYIHPVKPGASDPQSTPFRSTIIITRIGRRQDIGESGTRWEEPALDPGQRYRKELFLTAVGPGLITFHAYQPYHHNVFSLHDELKDNDQRNIDKATVDYQVIGWYSDPGQEELDRRLKAGGATVDSVLADLGWKVTGRPASWRPTSTTYCGRARSVDWNRCRNTQKPPDSNRPKSRDRVKVAVGSSADEASAALRSVLAPAGLGTTDSIEPGLLHALGRGLIDTLDGPDGLLAAAQAVHRGWFEQSPGGHIWRIVNTAEKGNTSGKEQSVTWSGVARTHERMLATLNTDQAAYDQAARTLAALQWRLYALWWMHGRPRIPPQYSREELRAETDPDNPESLATKVAARQEKLNELRKKIPHGATPKELADSIANYLKKHPLPPGHELRRESLPPFWQVTDPTVVISGGNGGQQHPPLDGTGSLLCRMPSQLENGITPTDPLPQAFTHLKITESLGIPKIVPALLAEFLHVLDSPDEDIPPEIKPPRWRQPWKPLLYQWKVFHEAIGYGTVDHPHWEFDGTRYRWKRGTAGAKNKGEVRGRRFLIPLPQYTTASQLTRCAEDYDGHLAEAFTTAAAQARGQDLLSQELDGLTDSFANRDTGPNLAPPGIIGELVGDACGHLPVPGPMPEPFDAWQPSGFTQIRAGRIKFTALCIVDEFGQSFDVYLPSNKNLPIIAPSLLPPDNKGPKFGEYAQLPPRLLQPARLNFTFVNEHNDNQPVDLTAETTPVCAWIIPSYVDRSLLCYAPTGAPLGELTLKRTTGPTGTALVVGWNPLPHSDAHTLDDLRTRRPHLYRFAVALAAQGKEAFMDLLSTTDRALTSIDPGNPYGDDVLGTLLGRPVALVRTRLGFELDGPPVSDPGWQYARNWRSIIDPRATTHLFPPVMPPEVEHLGYHWPIRLGNAAQRGDGLIGYFDGDDYGTFYSVTAPGTPQPTDYVQKISADNWPSLPADSTTRTHLTLMVDPQAAVHATTDLLPVADLRLPSRFTRTAMAAMTISLRLSPVLAALRKIPLTTPARQPASQFSTALALAHPATPRGTWNWSELHLKRPPSGDDSQPTPVWTDLPVAEPDQTARLDEDDPTVRTGYLRLTGGFGTS
ncbi:hypothetical protein [Streptomyces sp. URMC 129]|uniref:hypothetical protein n=1 Tax=Streptomyces sp. URMC 129 TaxID=3423407 RepID=UPI003F1CA551